MSESLKEVLSANMLDFTEHDTFYTGYVLGNDNFNSFLNVLRASGYTYMIRTSSVNEHGAFYFQNMRKDAYLQIPFFGAIYEHLKTIHYECIQGTKRIQKLRYDNKHFGKAGQPTVKKQRVALQPPKKFGCSATMHVVQIAVFPEYKIAKYNARGSDEQTKLVKKLKADIAASMNNEPNSGSPPSRHDRYMIRISKEEAHNHPKTTSLINQTLHSELRTEIVSLVKKNIWRVKDIRSHLIKYVNKNVEEGAWPAADPLNRCFYPTDKIIYNHMQKAIFELKGSYIDQASLANYLQDFASSSPEESIFYRPYKELDLDSTGDSEECPKTSFLFCHQTCWQKHLLGRYGNYICLLDAPYKTNKNSLPLFFLTVKTNVGYSVAGQFIIHSETPESIEEALKVFAEWNPNWQPLYFMTDFRYAEINAVEKTFPESKLYLSAFLCEQAWHRFLSFEELTLSASAKSAIEQQLKTISISKTDSEFNGNVQAMKFSKEYLQYPEIHDYIEKEWLPESYRWVQAHFTKDFVMQINMNNGVESQSKELKHTFLKNNTNKSLLALVQILLEEYLPGVLEKYCCLNAKIPNYPCQPSLQNRPMNLVRHILHRLSIAKAVFNATNISTKSFDTFAVKSESDEGPVVSIVDFNAPSCTCVDFSQWRYPCKHFCAVFLYVRGKAFDNLPINYIDSPYMTIDDAFCNFDKPLVKEGVEDGDSGATNHTCEESRTVAENESTTLSLALDITEFREKANELRQILQEIYDQSFLIKDINSLNESISHALVAKLALVRGLSMF